MLERRYREYKDLAKRITKGDERHIDLLHDILITLETNDKWNNLHTKEEQMYFGIQDEIKGIKDFRRTYELSQPYSIPKQIPKQIPYRHLVTLAQIETTWYNIKTILKRTNQITGTLSKNDEQHLKQRTEHVRNWLETFAPDMVKFEIKQKPPKITLDTNQKQFLSILNKKLTDLEWTAENIHKTIYDVSEQEHLDVKTGFTTLYQLLLNQKKGPRLGYCLSNLDQQFLLNRITEAIK